MRIRSAEGRRQMEAYLDNSATTKVSERVMEAVLAAMTDYYGNPSAMHSMGVRAENKVREARELLARLMKVGEKEIYFTSGGTEANNMALIGAAMANRRAGNRILTTQIEHASVSNTMAYLKEQGFDIVALPVDSYGQLQMQALRKAMTEDTILVSVMYVNNEIGAVEPIEEINHVIRAVNPSVAFHVDAIQAFGKYKIYPKRLGIDLLSVSGHKLHAPKGVGFLYKNAHVKVKPILFGGGQQDGLRSGTLNVPGIVGLAVAAEESYTDFDEKQKRLYNLKELFVTGIQKIEGTKINGYPGRESAPHIVSVSFDGVRSEVLLHALEEQEVYVSAGSACSSHKASISPTFKALGLEKKSLDATLRFSFSTFTTEQEICSALEALRETLPVLRKVTGR